jgi:hypothetical protein
MFLNSENKTFIDNCKIKIDNPNISNSTILKNKLDNITNNYVNSNNSINEIEIDLSYPDELYLNETISYLKSLEENLIKKICSDCLNKLDDWKDVESQVNIISNDMKNLIINYDKKTEITSLFSYKINQLNSAISKMQNSYLYIKIIKGIKCFNETEIEEALKKVQLISNDLVDMIQKSIRKKNININFILLQEKN